MAEDARREKEPLVSIEVSGAFPTNRIRYNANNGCSFSQTVLNTTSFMVGAGLLNVPLALVESRWYGALMVIFVAILCTYTSQILVKCLDAVRWSRGSPVSYGAVAGEVLGDFGTWVIDIQVYLSLFSSACGRFSHKSVTSECLSRIGI